MCKKGRGRCLLSLVAAYALRTIFTNNKAVYMQTTKDMTSFLTERLLRYCAVDTQSDAASTTRPSTECQLVLLRMLVDELHELGITDACLTEYGAVLATIPSNVKHTVPTIAFVAHVDTAPSFKATGVKPLLHKEWDGADIVLPDNPELVLSAEAFPLLAGKQGEDIVTASGTTLLGADDKAGIAVIMGVVLWLREHPDVPHGDIRVCFTPDEEIGEGVTDELVRDLACDFAYTIDGEDPGTLTYESFSADKAIITFEGVSIHTGSAKDKLVNALFLAAKFINTLPQNRLTPETTSGYEGFIFADELSGNAAECSLEMNLRHFELDGLEEQRELIREACVLIGKTEPRAKITCEFAEQYRNMRYWLENDMRPVEIAREAFEEVGLQVVEEPIRGGTDGSLLTEKGIPTPNIFCGMQNVHGPYEWVSIQDMEKAMQVCVLLSQKWAHQ